MPTTRNSTFQSTCAASIKMQACWNDALTPCMRGWYNRFILNPSKFDVIRFVCQRAKQVRDHLQQSASPRDQPSTVVQSVILDPRLTFDRHVAAVFKVQYFHIRPLRHIRESLPEDVAETVASNTIDSSVDYCNSFLGGMSETNLAKLLVVQNTYIDRSCNGSQSLRPYHSSSGQTLVAAICYQPHCLRRNSLN